MICRVDTKIWHLKQKQNKNEAPYLIAQHVPRPGCLSPAPVQFQLQFETFLLPVDIIGIDDTTRSRIQAV
jgi:hypothetical protein